MNYYKIKAQVPEALIKTTTFQCTGVKPVGKVAVGFGLAGDVGKEVLALSPESILLITDQTMINHNIAEIVIESLQNQGCKFDIFSEVKPEPKIETARAIQKTVRKKKYSTIIGLGGGSVMDMAKVASLTATNQEDIEDYMTGKPLTGKGLPNILLPTTSGTGSEVSPFIVISKEEKKLFIKHPFVYPTIALVDPLLSVTMPPKTTASTGLDALAHGVEGLVADRNPMTEALSTKCVEYVFKYLERAYRNGLDMEARYYMSFASVLGMMSYAQGGGLYAHSMSYLLTLHNGLPHGIGCGIALPYTLLFNYDYIETILHDFSEITISEGAQVQGENPAIEVIKEFYNLLRRVNVPPNLKELAISKDMITVFADELRTKYYRDNNPRTLKEKESQELVSIMWEGTLKLI